MNDSSNTTESFKERQAMVEELSNAFKVWHQSCVEKSLNIGPVNTDLVRLWSDVKNLNLSDSYIIDIVRLNE